MPTAASLLRCSLREIAFVFPFGQRPKGSGGEHVSREVKYLFISYIFVEISIVMAFEKRKTSDLWRYKQTKSLIYGVTLKNVTIFASS